jgi:hypothetical protein
MANIKYTKTATFLFPLLGIPKAIFSCNIKNTFGNTIITNRFINAYTSDSSVDNYKEGFVFILINAYQDTDFNCFYDTLTAFDNYVDDYEREGCLVVVFSILEKFQPDYVLLTEGKYSKVSGEAKKAILQNNFFSPNNGQPSTIPLILNKSEALKNSWEKRLDANLYDQEVWSILLVQNEQLCDDVFEELVENVGNKYKKLSNLINKGFEK